MAGRHFFQARTRFAIALLTLFAFTAQAIVTQTHIHVAMRSGIAKPLATGDLAHGPLPDKAPSGDDQANCPICQGLAHAGAYVTPSAAAVIVSAVSIFFSVVVIEIAAMAQAHSHAWKSRAPPRA